MTDKTPDLKPPADALARLKTRMAEAAREPSRPTTTEQSPSYRSQMKDAGRGRLLP